MSLLAEKNLTPALSRRDIGLFLVTAFVIADLHDVTGREGLLTFLDGLARQNLFFCFAVYVAFWRLLRSPTVSARTSDFILLTLGTVLFGLAAFLAQPMAAGLVLSGVVMAFSLQKPDREFRSALIVMAALAINSFWGPLFFQTFTDQVISIDVAALRMIDRVLRPDITFQGATFRGGDGFAIIVIGACSVFNSASVAVLATTAMIQRMKVGLGVRDFAAILVVLAVMLLINSLRLAILGWSQANYAFWHSGPGLVWFSAGETLAIAAAAYFCAKWAAQK